MAATKFNIFKGVQPRFPESLLPENAATIAQNCDFAYGELRNTKDGFLLTQLSNNARSVYTDDGLTFFSWEKDVDAVRSPMSNDIFNRLYYSGDNGIKVTDRTTAKIDGGMPSSSYFVGVPRPTVPPTLSVTLPVINDQVCNIIYRFHYEKSGIKYQDQEIRPQQLDNSMKWRVTPAAKIGKFKEYSSVDSFPEKGSTNYIYKDTGTDKCYLWSQYAQAQMITSYNSLASLPKIGDVKVFYWIRTDKIDKVYRFDGSTYNEIKQKSYNLYTDFPTSPSTAYLYYDGHNGNFYKNEYVETTFTAASTPTDAFPVFRLIASSKLDGSQICDVYSNNSSFAAASGAYSMAGTKEDKLESYIVTLTIELKESDKETRAYIYTYANTYNEEGPPSDPVLVTTSPIIPVNITVTKDTQRNYAPIKEIRVYRTPTGSKIADYFFVTAIPVVTQTGPQFTFLDDIKGAELNEPLSSANYYAPPQDLTGLMQLPNGILAAYRGNEMFFSEAYRPWAWPPEYVQVLSSKIVSAMANGSGALVTTVSNPYLISGVSPDSMTAMRLNADQAGVSKWSIAVVNGVCVYASHDGIVSMNGATASLERSLDFFTRDVWRKKYINGLSSMRFSVWDGRLIVFSGNNSFVPFMLRFDEADSAMTDLPTFTASTAFVSVLSDQCYYVNGKNLYEFNGGNDITATWQSREIVLQRPVNFGIAQAMVEGTWSIEFYAYRNAVHTLFHTQTLNTGLTTFRLPSGFESDRYRIKIIGKGKFRELRVAQTARELGAV